MMLPITAMVLVVYIGQKETRTAQSRAVNSGSSRYAPLGKTTDTRCMYTKHLTLSLVFEM